MRLPTPTARPATTAPGRPPDGYASPGGTGQHRAEPGGYGRPEPAAGDPGFDTTDRSRGPPLRRSPAPPHPWPETNGYHLDSPAPPAVNGYRLDEPVAPVTGFPYTAPPSTPNAYPVNGHGVDAAERDAWGGR